MLISCGIAAKSNLNLTISNISGFMLQDTSNPQASIKTEEWPIKQITDLQGDGFPLDGSCAFYVPEPGSEDGKIGLRTHIGGSGSLTVSASSEIPSLTIYTEGEGTITAGSSSYEACGVNIIPVNATSVSLTFSAANATERIIVYTIIPGVSISWDQDTIVSVELDLRSDLALTNTRRAVSEIEIRGYYPYDISEAVTGISDDVPIWYTAGYRGNMSPERRFYLSEPVKMENNIVTIRGHDSSYKLTKKGKAAANPTTIADALGPIISRRIITLFKISGIFGRTDFITSAIGLAISEICFFKLSASFDSKKSFTNPKISSTTGNNPTAIEALIFSKDSEAACEISLKSSADFAEFSSKDALKSDTYFFKASPPSLKSSEIFTPLFPKSS